LQTPLERAGMRAETTALLSEIASKRRASQRVGCANSVGDRRTPDLETSSVLRALKGIFRSRRYARAEVAERKFPRAMPVYLIGAGSVE